MSSSDESNLLAEYALGTLDDPNEIVRAKQLIADDREHAAELAELHTSLTQLAFALDPVAPKPGLRDRLLASTRAGRFDRFADKLAELFDVSAERAKQLLALIDDPDQWQPGPCPGSALIHFSAGPACAGADTGFVRVRPGVQFAWHQHKGEETTLVLQGRCVDSDGASYAAGDVFVNQTDTQHDFSNPDDAVDYLFAVRVFGVDFDVEKPGD